MSTLKHEPRKHGDPLTTGRQESASQRRKRRRLAQRVPTCSTALCKRRAERQGACGNHHNVR